MASILTTSFFALQMILLFFWAYWIFISLFGFGRPSKIEDKLPSKRFLILVPAHNEEKVVGNLVRNLKDLDYPDELYDVVVIADNCTDKTAEIAKELGAIALEHTSKPGELRGKPYGIKYAVDQIGDDLTKKYDGICFFDADNLVSRNYLKEMNNHLLKGDKLIQSYLDSKNPGDNWVTLSYATSYYYMNRSWQLAKSRLGLGNAIGGTGFCVDTTLFKEVGWTARSLTEDLEFTMQCLLKGTPAKWCHHARVYDEKPESFIASCVQRLRWARGHWDVCFKYAPKLMYRAIRKADILAFDGFIYLVNPGRIILNALTGLILVFSQISTVSWLQSVVPWQLWLTLLVFQFSYVVYTMVIDSNNRLNKVKAIISLVVFNFSYIPLFFWSLFTKGNKTWKRTEHTRSIVMEEIDVSESEVAAGKESKAV
ncbi:glycosyltransferase family 2 protein [Litchfieldia alkalitelluris]|uniref:glycosyltransferase family 2 protein n=1 Tax=Litchfieldia alkalitelluris TaxID=304268 RepID=UPI0009965427|nr:glycosyltransferase family 2 protein [Litchfieldia alkalitelluris]